MIPTFTNLHCMTVGWPATFFFVVDYIAYVFAFWLAGYAIVNGNLYISFILGFLYWFSVFAGYALSLQFAQPKPLCTLLDTLEFQEFRELGMPSSDAFIFAVLITFLLGLQTLTERGLPLQLELSILLIYPLWLLSQYINRNATIAQLTWGTVGGFMVGLYSIAVFHYVAKSYWKALGCVPVIGWLLVTDTSANPTGPDRDRDSIMLFPDE
jgi:hypothetical protein